MTESHSCFHPFPPELTEARRWLREHPDLGSLPGPRFENGESKYTDPEFIGEGLLGKHGRVKGFGGLDPDEWEQMAKRLGWDPKPLWASHYSIEQRLLAVRLDIALQKLPRRQRRLLYEWAQGASIRSLARKYRCRLYAMQGRLRTALADFKRAVTESLDEMLALEEL